MKQRFEALLAECPVVAILRGITPGEVCAVCDVLYRSGIRILEIPLNSPDPFTGIEIASGYMQGRMMVGAGTVLTPEDVRKVKEASGTFCISPNTDPEVIAEVKKCNMLSMPGFFTASEGFAALKAGADYLKLFPASLGPGYVKDLKAVLKALVFAVGGVNKENIGAFLKCCAGVGIGSALYKGGKNLSDLARDTEEILAQLRK